MKQYRFSTADFVDKNPGVDDAVLDPNDPVFQIANGVVPQMNYNELPAWQQNNPANDKARIMREQGIKPGTPAWFQLWYGR